jgi:hypothetical protein
MTGQQANAIPKEADMTTTMRTGHHRLADGSLLRVDIEQGRWVGRLYTPELTVKSRVVGTEEQVHAWADTVAA